MRCRALLLCLSASNRLISALVFDAIKIKDYKDPDKDFAALLAADSISSLTRDYQARVRKVLADDYANALIPTLFKNQTKCKDVIEKCDA